MNYTVMETQVGDFVVPARDKFLANRTHFQAMINEVDEVFTLLRKVTQFENMIEVGACVGQSCITAMKREHVKRCLALEPCPENYRLLRANCELNDCEGMIHFRCAVAEIEGMMYLGQEKSDNAGSWFVLDRPKLDVTMGVPCTTLDSIPEMDQGLPPLIWIDAQGSEAYVLAGAQNFLKSPAYIEVEIPCLERTHSLDYLQKIIAERFTHFVDMRDSHRAINKIESFREIYKTIKTRGHKMTNCLLWSE